MVMEDDDVGGSIPGPKNHFLLTTGQGSGRVPEAGATAAHLLANNGHALKISAEFASISHVALPQPQRPGPGAISNAFGELSNSILRLDLGRGEFHITAVGF
jgi:hypothetical protein